MRIERDITFYTAEGFECLMRVTADVDIHEDEFTFKIDTMEMIQFHGYKVSVPLDEIDCKGEINRQIWDALDDYISTNADEMVQAEADYFHDLAFDRWKESKEHE